MSADEFLYCVAVGFGMVIVAWLWALYQIT